MIKPDFSVTGGNTLSFIHGLFSRQDNLPLDNIRGATLYRNMLVINHDDGFIRIQSSRDRLHELAEIMKALPDCHYEEFDAKVKLKEDNPLATTIFYVAATLAISGVIFFISLGDTEIETNPITFLLYLIPGFCIAYLAKRGFDTAADAVGNLVRDSDSER